VRKSFEMSQVVVKSTSYRFDQFLLDAANRQLWRDGEVVPLNSRYFDVLLLLISECGQLIEKQRIFDEIWNGVFVTDAALTQCIKDIRRQLGDDAANPRYIKTVPKHGYIFIGEATEARALPDAAPDVAPRFTPRPYKFLDYYTEQDAQLFFGREAEVEAICSQILARRSFILHGRSGVGKSSIVRAGVIPRLKEQGHLVLTIRSFTDPLHEMLEALAAEVNVNDAAMSDEAASIAEAIAQADLLKDYIERVTRTEPQRYAIFFLDQFEEFFLLLSEESRERFVAAMTRLLADETLPVKLVFALREDVLAEMSQFKTAIAEIYHHEYRLKRLSREPAARAITEPALAVGCQIEPQLVTRLLDDLSEQGTIDPPQLQIVCDCLFDSKTTGNRLTVAAYESLGTASQILAGYLERVLRRFHAAALQVAKAILTTLISDDGQRLVLRVSTVKARVQSAIETGNKETDAVLMVRELIAARVVRRRNQDGEAWLELAHDFLTSEVSRWLTAEDRALKQARNVLERATENHRAHQLLIDTDALDLLLPFGEQLNLTGEEAQLFTASLINRGRQAPEWLLRRSAVKLPALIAEATTADDMDVRLSAIAACRTLRDDDTKALLRHVALWDKEIAVRKAATIALADWFGTDAATVLSKAEDKAGEHPGTIRRSISLAMVRDYDKRLLSLTKQSPVVSFLVVGALMWVRLLRGSEMILRQGVAGTLGASSSGLAGGLMLGLALAMARQSAPLEAASLIFVLVSLGTFIGALGGLGVSFGMVAASHITYRHSRWWSVVGGAAGGAVVGGVTKLLGVDIIRAVFGQHPSGITGAMEGAVIGAGVTLGAVLMGEIFKGARPLTKVIGAALGAMVAGVLLTIIGGNLFSGSLEVVARSFSDSQIRMEPLSNYFSAVQFSNTRQMIFGAIEGLMFGAGLMSGIEYSSRPKSET